MSYPPTPPGQDGPPRPYGADPDGTAPQGSGPSADDAHGRDPYAQDPYGPGTPTGAAEYAPPYGTPGVPPYGTPDVPAYGTPTNPLAPDAGPGPGASEDEQRAWLLAQMRGLAAQGGPQAAHDPSRYPAAVVGQSKPTRVRTGPTIPTGAAVALAFGAVVVGGLGAWFVTTSGAGPVPNYANPVAVDPAASGDGTRLAPYRLGETVATGDWTITLGEPVDSTEQILADNPYFDDDRPLVGEGERAYLVPVTLENTSDRTLDPQDVVISYWTNDGMRYSFFYCGEFPDALDEAEPTAPGETVEYTECVVAPAEGPGQWMLSTDQAFGTFFTRSTKETS
ncbi:hypothetical protein CLV28_0273 [Sediminihabitans luteus]|uniref:DUF4352 domain-containing protein n=1 Tax=Sediminihabitans luteus TaxID=1138585 RepID=A0A2M9CYP4_9CELL|nr:hypothetical protein [Sediminihabitans luteus]PJJ77061.1 hypothetical protein CLV28_0273 [Sediminihabitans luteus]GIJ00420.1 hypothetical protein Slu03_27970 [Sediminihabitans luteus]